MDAARPRSDDRRVVAAAAAAAVTLPLPTAVLAAEPGDTTLCDDGVNGLAPK